MLSDLIRMMAADGKLSEVEKRLFALAAAKMGVERKDLEAIIDRLVDVKNSRQADATFAGVANITACTALMCGCNYGAACRRRFIRRECHGNVAPYDSKCRSVSKVVPRPCASKLHPCPICFRP